MSESTRTDTLMFVDGRDLARGRLEDSAGAARLDHLSTGNGLRGGAVLVGVIVGLIGLFGEVHAAMFGAMFPAYVSALGMAWDADAKEHGGVLRRVVGLSRRSIVTARYREMGVVAALALGVAATLNVGVLALMDEDPTPAAFAYWAMACFVVVCLCVGIPMRIRDNAGLTFIATAVVGVAVVVVVLLVTEPWIGGGGPPFPGGPAALALACLMVLGLLVAVGVPISHRVAVRLYEERDL